MKFFFLIITISSLLVTCDKKDSEPDRPVVDFSSDRKAAELIHSDNDFALKLFKKVSTGEADENFMISPLSVAIALGMTYNGSGGETKLAFEETLGLTGLNRHEINKIHGALISHLITVDPEVQLEIANSIWIDQNFLFQREFADTNRYYYDAEMNSLDFNDPGSIPVINEWVNDKTGGKISNILDQIPPQTIMYLINAIYFSGSWKYAFDEDDNLPIHFQYEDGSEADVEGMRMQQELDYLETEKFSIVSLPYGNEKYSMLIFLPGEGWGYNDITGEMSLENLETWTGNLRAREIKLQMPRFKFEYKTLLNDVLKDMGLGTAFGEDAEFPFMVQEEAQIFISRILHKTFVDVNEEGTEAAAVTAVEVGVTSVGPGDEVISFVVDRPFLFMIRENTSNTLVFMGKVGSPEYE